jgi:Thioesterase superfamily
LSATLDPPAPEELEAEPGWTPMGPWPFPHGKPGRFVVGDESGSRYRIRYYRDAADPECFHGKVWFGPGAEGPPLHAHGGSIAALLDEAAGMSCWVTGTPVVAATLTVHFRRMLPLGTVVQVEARIRERSSRRMHVRARLFRGDEVYANAEGEFAVVGGALAGELAQAMADRER